MTGLRASADHVQANLEPSILDALAGRLQPGWPAFEVHGVVPLIVERVRECHMIWFES